MGPIYENFKFQISDFVEHVAACGQANRKMQVIERWYQECPGGVQLHYTCQEYQCDSVKLLEISLRPFAETKAEIDEAEWMVERISRMSRELMKHKKTDGADEAKPE